MIFFERFWFQYTKTQNVNIFFRLLGQEIVEFLLRKCHLAIKINWRLCCKLKRAMTMISISRLPPWQKRVAKKRGEDGLLTQEFENGKKILSTNKMVKKLIRQTGIFWIIWATWTNLNTYSLSRRIIDEKSSLFTLLRRLYCKNLREVKKESKKIKYVNLLSGYILVYKCFLIECISWTEYIRSK